MLAGRQATGPIAALQRILGARWTRMALPAALFALVVGPVSVAHADQLFSESFTHPTVSAPDLSVGAAGGGAPFRQVCLTASTNTAQTPIPGCTAGQASIPAGGDPDGSGALRLTDNENNVAGFMVDNQALPLTAGLDITFDYFSYNTTNTPADGLSLFLVNGATTLTAPGANGGSLGYAQRNGSPGVANGYLGVGLDEYGNYTNDTENRGNGCATRSPLTGLHKNYVGLRGPGNGTTGYCLLANGPAPAPLAVGAAKVRTAAGVKQVVEIKVDPPGATSPKVTVIVNGTQVLQAAEPPNPPPTFKFGFAASTGGATDIHEIQAVTINTVLPLPKLTVSQTPNGAAVAGQPLTYTLRGQVSPSGGSEANPVTISDALPPGVTVLSLPTGSGWDCSATPIGSSKVSCTYTPNPASPLAPGSALPPISLPTLIASDAHGALTSTAVISSSDNGNTPPQSTATATVIPTPAPPPPRLPPPPPPIATPAQADAYVQVSPPSTPPEIGQPAVFTVTAGNKGPDADGGVTVSIPAPSGSKVVSVPPACQVTINVILCVAGKLDSGAKRSFDIIVAPDAPGPLSMNATVTGDAPDNNPANNAASAETIVPAAPSPAAADLSVQIAAASQSADQSSPVTFHVTVADNGPSPATGVVVAVPLPPGSSPVSVPHGCRLPGAVVICDIGNLSAHQKRTLTLTVRPNGAGTLGAIATVRANQPDSNPHNNRARADVTVHPKLKLSDRASRRSTASGGHVTFTLTVATASMSARHVTVCDSIPRGVSIVGAHGGHIHGQRVCFTLSRLTTKARKLKIEVVAGNVSRSVTVRDSASATAPDTKRARASAALRLVAPPVPSFTG